VQKMTLADNLREVSAVQASVEGPSKVGRVPQPQSVQTGVSQPVGDGQEGGQQSLVLNQQAVVGRATRNTHV